METINAKAFIRFITQNKSLTAEQRARADALLARDCLNANKETTTASEPAQGEGNGKPTTYNRHHSPQKTYIFLSLFSRDDRFKWFTHKWDQANDFNIGTMKDRLKTNKRVLSKMAYTDGDAVNEKTYNQVWNFINFDNAGHPWFDNTGGKQTIGWHSIIDLQKNNPDCPVENLKLVDGHLFKDYINRFKCSIEFRTDMNDDDRFSEFIYNSMYTHINGALTLNMDQSVDDIGYDINVYCDVAGLYKGLARICSWMVQHKTLGSDVNVCLRANVDNYELEIFHKGSYFNNLSKLETPSGDFAALRDTLFSVCDFEMLGDLHKDGEKKGAVRVVGLGAKTYSNGKGMTQCEISEISEPVGGIKYLIRIFKI